MLENIFILVGVIVGGAISVAGGAYAQYKEFRMRGALRRKEILAEKEIEACAWMYSLLKKIILFVDPKQELTEDQREKVKSLISNNEEEFWKNNLFLPEQVVNFYRACIVNVNVKDWQNAKNLVNQAFEEISIFVGREPLK